MPRPIFESHGRLAQPTSVTTTGPATRTAGRMLTAPRSARYLAAVRGLDASATLTPPDLARIADDLAAEFTEKWAAVPLGFVGHCYLGPPYEAHTLTIDGQIIEHYQRGQALPGPLEAARSLARTEHYLVIEVFSDRLVAVRTDGSVVTVGG